MVHPLLNGYIASLCCSVANTPPTIWTNLEFQQYTALVGPSWAFIHSSHFIELIEKHRDSFPWLGPFYPQDLTSNIRYHVPDLIFPAAALTELTALEHLCSCLSERRGEEGVGPLLSALSPVLQSYNCYRRELQSHNDSPSRAPWQCDNSVKSQQLNTAQLNWTYSGHRAGLETWDMDQRDKHDGDIYIE